jgi:DNA-binding GntR family transcriptional regulator
MAIGEVTRVVHKTMHERVYEELVRLIANATLAPGAPLDEQSLADRLGVSRTPLRAAIARLVQEGLVVTTPYRGAFVRRFSAKEIDGLYEIRTLLEQLAVRRAAERIDAAQLAALAGVVAECEAAFARGDVASVNAADAELHRLLVTTADNPALLEVLDSLRLRIAGLRAIVTADLPQRAATRRERGSNRRQIVQALRRRDGETAARLMAEHIEPVRRSVLAHVAAGERDGEDAAVPFDTPRDVASLTRERSR